MQHAGLRMAQIQPAPRSGDGDVHQPPFFFQSVVVIHRIFVREQALFHAGDEHTIKLETFGCMHRHQLHRILPRLRLVIA